MTIQNFAVPGHSVRKFLVGLDNAAFRLCRQMVVKEMISSSRGGSANIHQLRPIWNA